jgi:hypothetical protein
MLMLAGFGLTLVLGWMACRQALANLGTFLLDGFLIARDYDQASGMEGLPMLRAEAFLVGAVGLATVVIGTLTALASLDREGRWRRVILFGWLAGLLFLVWKHSMVRVDRSHTAELLVFTPVLAFALETLPSSQHKLRQIARVLALGCCALSFWVLESAFLPGLKTTLSEPFHQFVYHANCIFSPADWSRLMEPALAERQREAQLPKLRKLIGDATVDVFGSLQAHALLNKLNYRPRPVFQSYAAYNPRLARLNEEFYLSDRAPNYVLFDLFAVEHRFPTLNDGPALRSLLTNYEPVAAEDVFLLLKRKSSEPARLTLLSEGIFKTRDRLDLGKYPDDDLWLEFEVTPTVAGRLMTFLVRPPPLRLSVWMDGPTGLKRLVRRRAVPSLLKTGFVGSPCLLNSEDVRDLYTAERIVRASDYSLEPDPGSEQMWQQTVRFRLYKIENRLGRCVSRELGPILKLERRGPVGSERRAEP